ncbi:MAG TPA: MarR family winged helix-turn-helix transcriptional regulator [Jatrophihabitans sp.]|jgi:DNA-binding MarR family transcriptional regulator|uniref:MarR family winged helix-turn-helix transcriptional regulator n=1 Tax=Jatrophihabitans sp. TaxID=1932789 RepID=UPI002E0CA8BA|nr:MarR family winged helix-turn-helix transcriptional regulator [Jatrophihabitans sp.]
MPAREPEQPTLVDQWRHMVAGVDVTRRRLDAALEASGVSPQFYDVLHLLLHADNHALPMTLLAREISMTSGGFTKLADRMAREGLIDRRSSSDDRRVVNATLTDAGRALATRASALYDDALRACLLGPVSAADLAVAATVLRALAAVHGSAIEVEPAAASGPAPFDPSRQERRRAPR